MSTSKSYLGDAVYAHIYRTGDLVLTTEDGYNATNTIILEPPVWAALKEYMTRAEKAATPRGEEK